jgi:subtilisin family serine protease
MSLRSHLAWRAPFLALFFAAALAPSPALAMSATAADSNLSARLDELAGPLRSAPESEQAARLSLAPSGPGSLQRAGGRVLVEVRLAGDGPPPLAELRQAGAEIVQVGRRYGVVTVAARPADLPRVGAVAGVAAVTEVLAPLARGVDCGGVDRSEGDAQLNAAAARAGFGLDGSGVTVGILSDSFDRRASAPTHAAGDVASGDLPGSGSPCGSSAPVGVLDDSELTGSDEGRAMAQVVHDLAPGATIDFADAFGGESAFAANIKALAAAGAQVIADDVSYFQEPFFQDGPVAVAVAEAVASGVSYFAAAGNDNLIDAEGNDISSWEAPEFRDSSSCPAVLASLPQAEPTHCMDFDPGPATDDTFGITVEAGQELAVDLQWAEPWQGVGTDLDAFLLNKAGEFILNEGDPVAALEDNVNRSERPFEFFSWKNKGLTREVQLVINRFSGGDPRIKFALLENGRGVTETEYPRSTGGDVVGPTVFGHSAAAGAIGVGAVRYNDASKPERFSSRGPVKHLFGPVISSGPAAPIAEQVIAKPNLVATDGGVNTFFGTLQEGAWRFFGTSAAAPHAAAVAALVRQANPGASAAQVRAALESHAGAVGVYGPTAVGAGLINADDSVTALALPPRIAITKAPAPLSRERRPAIEFSANRPVTFSCEIDGGPTQACTSPFVAPTALADGTHSVAVSGLDLAGRSGSSSTAAFAIDTRAPGTVIAAHPPKLIRSQRQRVRAVFRFKSNERRVTFGCKVDRGPLRVCGRRLARRFGPGRHTVRVRARDSAGNADRTPAVFHFRVERIG